MGNPMIERAPKSVVILGATSAMARACALDFASRGYRVVLAAQDAEENEINAQDLRVRHGVACKAIAFQALHFEAHAGFLAECEEALGELAGGVVLFFGYMAEQAAAEKDFAEARKMIDVNLTAAVSVLEAFAARMEQRGSGFIGVVSSVAGDRGRASNYLYGMTKAGLTAYASGLRNRLFKKGVAVTTIKPGFVDTKMTFGLPLPGPLVASPEKAGGDICRAVLAGKNEVYVPFFWRYIMLIIQHLPEFQFKKMKL